MLNAVFLSFFECHIATLFGQNWTHQKMFKLTTLLKNRKPHFVALLMLICVAALSLSACNVGVQAGGQQQAAAVDVAPAFQRTLPDVEEFTGRLEAAELVEIRPRIAGAIDQVHVKDGANVSRGALLFTIDARPVLAEVARSEALLATARAQARLADKESTRANVLLSQDAISRQEADQLAANLEATNAAVQQALATLRSARLNLEYTSVRAPVAGRVSRIDVTAGNLVNDQRVLTTLVGSAKMYAFFDASEQTYLRLRKAPNVEREVSMGLADEPSLPRKGTVDFIDNRLNPQSATIRVRASFTNTDAQLLPGLFARIRVNASAPRAVVVTPDRAVSTDQSRKFVWVVGADKLPQPRPVTLGALVDGMRVLESGVVAGELIIVSGLQRVRPGAPVSPNVLKTDEYGVPMPNANQATVKAGRT
jgi:membrane fusion protein, multidrug efflux system